jgi:hypothetical protein
MLVAAVGVAIFEQSHQVAVGRVIADLVAHSADHEVAPLLNRSGGEIIVEPVHVPAIVFDALVHAMRLGDEDATLRVEAEGDRIGQLRLACHRSDGEAFGHANRGRCELALR